MTYGQLKIRFVKAYPGVDLELIEGWIGDVYADILHELPWQRMNVTGVLQTLAPYTAGSLTLTNGSNAVTGLGTAFAAGMTGMQIRMIDPNAIPDTSDDTDEEDDDIDANPDDDIYTFTYLTALTGTLDRPYEGTGGAGLDYTIFQSLYTMPANCRLLDDNAFSQFSFGPLLRMDWSQLNQSDPSRSQTGTPGYWAPTMDDNSTPPNMRVELYPVPDQVYALPYKYQAEAPALSGTSVTMLPWVQVTALIEGVTARVKAHLKDYPGVQVAAALYKGALRTMRGAEAQGMAAAQMQLSDFFISHRSKRWNR